MSALSQPTKYLKDNYSIFPILTFLDYLFIHPTYNYLASPIGY